ncbi:Methyl-accepting chemotaxis sensor/transducer protein, partial [hydrothermal vent metagenome]
MKKYFKNLSLKSKLMGNAGILLSLLILSSVYAIYAMDKIGKELAAIAELDIPLTEKLTAIKSHQLEQVIQFERTLHYAAILQQQDSAVAHFRKAVKAFDEDTTAIEKEIREAEALTEVAILKTSGQTLKQFKSLKQALKNIEQQHRRYVDQVHQAFVAITQGKRHVAEQLTENLEQVEDKLDVALESVLGKIGQFTETSARRAEEHELAATFMLSVIAVVSLIFGILVSGFIASFIINAVRRAIVIASGDLTQTIEVDSTDEVGELLNAMNGMRQKLLDMLSQISGTTEQLSTASEEMSAITTQSSAIIQQQRSETEQVATAMNEMTATVQEVAGNINDTASAASEANDHTENGSQVVGQ